MRNGASGNGAGGLAILIPIVFVCGVLAVIAATRAEVFRPQPSQAVVNASYTTRAAIENNAARERMAADLAHAVAMQRLDEQFAQVARDMAIVSGGIGLIALLILVAAGGYRIAGHARLHANVIRPNRRGQFPILIDAERRQLFNPNMQTTATLLMDDPQALPAEFQIEAYAWQQRAHIAASMAGQRTMPITAMQERKLIQAGVLPALPQPGRYAPVTPIDAVTGEFTEVEPDPSGFISENGQTRPI